MEKPKGKFIESLQRNNKQIKGDRAAAIGEEAEITFKRAVEDLDLEIKRKKRQLENMLDMSPENSLSLMVAEKFDATLFTKTQSEYLVDLRNLEIKHELMSKQYNQLFIGEGEQN
jgi:hypothetical protein